MKYFGIERPVLEVGSGHRPYPHSDVLVDKFLNESQRGGKIETGNRPLIVSDIEQLPFRDGAFGYSIAAHVVEHVPHPEKALKELARVSRAGYIETPSALMEAVEPHREYHLWYVKKEGDKLVFIPKRQSGFTQRVSWKLLEQNFSFRLFFHSNPDLILTRCHWEGAIGFQIEKRPFHPDEYLPYTRQSAVQFIVNISSKIGEELIKQFLRWQRSRQQPVDIAPLIICPRCGGDLQVRDTRLVCDNCRGYYPRKENLYFLSKEYFVKGA